MDKKAKIEKWLAAGLGVVAVLAIVRAVSQASGVHAGGAGGAGSGRQASATPTPTAHERLASRRGTHPMDPPDDPVSFSSVLRLDELKAATSVPLPNLERSPFDFAPTPEEVKARKVAQELAKNPPPPPPPPPPPINLKALGYQQDEKGKFLAYLSDDQDSYIVQEGQEFAKRFKVLKISSSMVEIEDETYHQTVQLPFAQ